MPIITPGPTRRTDIMLDDFETPFADSLGATAEDAWKFSPLSSIGRSAELTRAQEGDDFMGTDLMAGVPSVESRTLTPEEANERQGDLGLEISEEGIRERHLQILMDNKKEENLRNSVLRRARSGLVASPTRFMTALAVSVLDPINVASAFIPVVSATRYASRLARANTRMARAGVRAKVGVVEGAVGAAIVEPIILAQAQREQSEYDLIDSVLNIAFGTIIGGGLHVGVGALADRNGGWARTIENVQPETKEAALKTAVSQLAQGKRVNVDIVLKTDPVYESMMNHSGIIVPEGVGGERGVNVTSVNVAQSTAEFIDVLKTEAISRIEKFKTADEMLGRKPDVKGQKKLDNLKERKRKIEEEGAQDVPGIDEKIAKLEAEVETAGQRDIRTDEGLEVINRVIDALEKGDDVPPEDFAALSNMGIDLKTGKTKQQRSRVEAAVKEINEAGKRGTAPESSIISELDPEGLSQKQFDDIPADDVEQIAAHIEDAEDMIASLGLKDELDEFLDSFQDELSLSEDEVSEAIDVIVGCATGVVS